MTIDEQTQEIREFFNENGIELDPQFSLQALADDAAIDCDIAYVMALNLEDPRIMQDIASCNYDTFNIFDSLQFNDGYEDVLLTLVQ